MSNNNNKMTSKQQNIEKLAQYILTRFNYGDTLYYEDVERLIGAERGEYEYVYTLAQAKNMLITYGMVLVPVINEGYRVLHPKEITDHVVNKYLLKSVATLDKGRTILHYTDREALNDIEQTRVDTVEKYIAEIQKHNEDQIVMNNSILLSVARQKELKGE